MTIRKEGEKNVRSEYSVGVILIIISAITFSTAGLFTKGVSSKPWDIIFWRGVFAAAFAILWTAYTAKLEENFAKMGWSGVAVGVVGALGTAAFIAAFKLTTVANVSMIYAVAPLIAVLIAWIWIGEKPSVRLLIGCFGALIGVVIIVYGSLGKVNLRGDALALWMAVAMALLMVIYRRYPKTPGAGPAALSSLLLLPPSFIFGDPLGIPIREIFILSAFGFIFAVASVTLAEGARRVPSGQTALLSTLETPVAPILAFIILSEVPSLATLVGGLLILIAIILTIRESN